MKGKIVNIFWGIILILVSGILLAQTLGYIDFEILSNQTWVLVFAIASAAFFLSYFLNGVRRWGWLFPAFIFAALALTMWMAIRDMEGSFIGVPILASIALPFYIGFALNRKRWGLLIPAFVLTVITLVALMADTVRGEWLGALVLFSIGLPFLVVYLVNRQRRWALIPAFILIVLAVITLIPIIAVGEWIGALVLYAIALPFLGIYLFDRSKRWALIPTAALAFIGTIPLLSAITSEDVTGAAIMFLFALPFFVVYFWSKNHWWALIPAGVFASIGLVVVLSILIPEPQNVYAGVFNGVLFLGWAVTFGILWLRRKSQPTDWAKYPAVGLLVAAILAFILGERFQDFLPATIMLVIGVMLLLVAFLRRKPVEEQPKPEDKI
jgi:hypothetical protein